jgi:hypothetical protein
VSSRSQLFKNKGTRSFWFGFSAWIIACGIAIMIVELLP